MLGLHLLLSVWYISSGFPVARTLLAKMVPALLQLRTRTSRDWGVGRAERSFCCSCACPCVFSVQYFVWVELVGVQEFVRASRCLVCICSLVFGIFLQVFLWPGH